MKTYESLTIDGKIVDIIERKIIPGNIVIEDGRITAIRQHNLVSDHFILPGLIDSHIHIESSMMIPSEFARQAVVHGTVATVSDPHEIANVMGLDGIRFMIANGKRVPFKFYFGAPSCVPATPFETSGATIGLKETDELLQMGEIHYLSEMMNYPGVLAEQEEVMEKIALARAHHKPVDGHAPGLKGVQAQKYIEAGISTDHECFTLEEATEKIQMGMNILMREGSAAKNFNTLMPLLQLYPEKVMFCSDDKHPDELIKWHINRMVKRAIDKGYDLMDILRSCIFNPVKHYHLNVGMLQKGDPADFIIVDNLSDFNVMATFIDGIKVAEQGKTLIPHITETPVNRFHADKIKEDDLRVRAGEGMMRVLKALDGQLITETVFTIPTVAGGNVVSDVKHDILKMTVVNRYEKARPAVGFVRGFGLRQGAMASSVAHDCHNIIALGTSDEEIVAAVNLLIDYEGGIAFNAGGDALVLPLPVAGIMSDKEGREVATLYEKLDKKVKKNGSKLKSPFMTLSFMALLVIPELKLGDKGLFDAKKFEFVELFSK
jgi:adenine deaminase